MSSRLAAVITNEPCVEASRRQKRCRFRTVTAVLPFSFLATQSLPLRLPSISHHSSPKNVSHVPHYLLTPRARPCCAPTFSTTTVLDDTSHFFKANPVQGVQRGVPAQPLADAFNRTYARATCLKSSPTRFKDWVQSPVRKSNAERAARKRHQPSCSPSIPFECCCATGACSA